MRFHRLATLLVIALTGVARESAARTKTSSFSVTTFSGTVARVYWRGIKQISDGTNAASVMSVWDLPQSQQFLKQTLDKFSFAPWRLLRRRLDTNAARLFRPLLDDVVQQPSFLEIQRTTNQTRELAFAIQLSGQRAAAWQTNLAAVLESLTGIQVVPATKGKHGWSLKKHHSPDFIQLIRVDDWIVLGAGQEKDSLFDDFVSHLRHHHVPFNARSTNNWFEMQVDLQSLSQIILPDRRIPPNLPRMLLSLTGDGQHVKTRGELTFSRPLSLDLPAWNIPTNLIDGALDSFTAVRGIGPYLASLNWWKDLQNGPAPNQMYFWSLQGLRMLTYFAAPLVDASNAVSRITDRVLQRGLPWLVTNELAGFRRSKKFIGLEWSGLPYMDPFFRSVTTNRESFVFGGFFPPAPVLRPLPTGMRQEIQDQTNLAYYSWELTGPRIQQWIYMGQFIRLVLQKAQLPPESLGMKWLEALVPKLGNCATSVIESDATHLVFTRKSTIGFTAVELHLLADWLESPQFPLGLHSFLAAPNVLSGKRHPFDIAPPR